MYREKGTNKEDKRPWANVCFTQAEPVGGCWQDARQMTALGWLFWGFEGICLHATGCASCSCAIRSWPAKRCLLLTITAESRSYFHKFWYTLLTSGQPWVNKRCVCLLVCPGDKGWGIFRVCNKTGLRSLPRPTRITFLCQWDKGTKKISILLCLVKVHNWEFCIKNSALQRELAFDKSIPSRPNFDCQSNKERSTWLYEPKYQIAYSYKASSAPRPMTDMVWWHQESRKIKKPFNKTTYVQNLDVEPATAVRSSHCSTAATVQQKAERLNQYGIFNFTAPVPLFYDLAKVLHTSSLQWLSYTHVVCNKLQKTTYCRTALRQLAAMYGE